MWGWERPSLSLLCLWEVQSQLDVRSLGIPHHLAYKVPWIYKELFYSRHSPSIFLQGYYLILARQQKGGFSGVPAIPDLCIFIRYNARFIQGMDLIFENM